jgi:hypothetical protein
MGTVALILLVNQHLSNQHISFAQVYTKKFGHTNM